MEWNVTCVRFHIEFCRSKIVCKHAHNKISMIYIERMRDWLRWRLGLRMGQVIWMESDERIHSVRRKTRRSEAMDNCKNSDGIGRWRVTIWLTAMKIPLDNKLMESHYYYKWFHLIQWNILFLQCFGFTSSHTLTHSLLFPHITARDTV